MVALIITQPPGMRKRKRGEGSALSALEREGPLAVQTLVVLGVLRGVLSLGKTLSTKDTKLHEEKLGERCSGAA